MAEITINKDERPGILKEIDEGALDLVFQAIQEDIYSFPIPSFVRETISNGLDGIVEREIAKKILAGTAQSEFYLQRTDDKLLKDSSFDDKYYDAHFLSSEDRVFVDYVVGHPRDTITIRDMGVGLGGSRLQGYFKIGYSSKRNMKDVIGKFGSGSKSALATGIEYFIMHTTYNGYRTSFMIFKNDYEAITPKHPDGKVETWTVKMSDGSVHAKDIFWEPRAEQNSVEVELEVKKHNKKAFINAVKNQFQYFNGKVRLAYEDDNSDNIIDHLNEAPLYESDHILIPQYSTYTVPHILVDGISYGPIDFPELELEKMSGKIALKTRATDVDITQSRETLKHTEKTKKTILKTIEIAREEATDYVTSLLDIDDPKNLFKLNDIYGRLSKDGSTAVAAVFSRFLSMHNLKPKFEFTLKKEVWNTELKASELMDKTVKARLNADLFDFLFYNWHVRELSTDLDGTTLKLESDRVSNFETLRFKKIVFAKTATLGPKLANHLLKKYDTESIIYIRPRTDRTRDSLEGPISGQYMVARIDEYMNSLLTEYAELNLDTYEVVYDETVEVENLEGAVVEVALTPAQERRLNEEVLYTYYDSEFNKYYDSSVHYLASVDRQRVRETVKVTKIGSHFKNENVLIVTGSYTKLGHFIEMSQIIDPDPATDMLIIYIAQDKVKHFAPHGTLITDYFRTVNYKTGELVIGEHIRKLNTLKHLRTALDQYSDFSKKYNILEAFTDVDFSRIKKLQKKSKNTDPRAILEEGYNIQSELIDDIFGYLDVLTEFQHVVKTGNKEQIAAKALEFFNSEEIYTVDAYDEEFIDNVNGQFEHINIVSPLLALLSGGHDLEDAKPLIQLLINTKHKEQDELKL